MRNNDNIRGYVNCKYKRFGGGMSTTKFKSSPKAQGCIYLNYIRYFIKRKFEFLYNLNFCVRFPMLDD